MTDKIFDNWLSTVQTFSKVQEHAENTLKELIELQRRNREQQTAILEDWVKQFKNSFQA